MTNLEALKELYVSIGGTASDFDGVKTTAEALRLLYAQLGGSDDVSNILTIAEMIRKVATCEIGGGGSLPDGVKGEVDLTLIVAGKTFTVTSAKTGDELSAMLPNFGDAAYAKVLNADDSVIGGGVVQNRGTDEFSLDGYIATYDSGSRTPLLLTYEAGSWNAEIKP